MNREKREEKNPMKNKETIVNIAKEKVKTKNNKLRRKKKESDQFLNDLNGNFLA